MKWVSVAFMVVLCGTFVVLMSCSAAQVKEGADVVQGAAKAAQAILPPPFGIIAAGVAGLAGIISSLAASKVKGAAVANGEDPHPIASFLSEHHWVYPALTAAISAANGFGWIHISQAELGTLLGAMTLATGVQVVSDGHADSKEPAATT